MKKSFLLLAGLMLATGVSASLRIVSYNIYHGEGQDRVINIDRAGSVIAKYNPDLVALQEVDKKTTRSGGVDQAVELGRKLGMEHHFKKAIDYLDGEYGIAILSAYPVKETIIHNLPTPEGQEPRGALEVIVEVPDEQGRTQILSFVCAHLGLSSEQRMAQAQALAQELSTRDHAVIIAGDLNAEPLEESIAVLARAGYNSLGEQNLYTYPATNPVKKIDYILTRNLPIRDFRFEVDGESKISDHRPIFCEIILKASGGSTSDYRSDSG